MERREAEILGQGVLRAGPAQPQPGEAGDRARRWRRTRPEPAPLGAGPVSVRQALGRGVGAERTAQLVGRPLRPGPGLHDDRSGVRDVGHQAPDDVGLLRQVLRRSVRDHRCHRHTEEEEGAQRQGAGRLPPSLVGPWLIPFALATWTNRSARSSATIQELTSTPRASSGSNGARSFTVAAWMGRRESWSWVRIPPSTKPSSAASWWEKRADASRVSSPNWG